MFFLHKENENVRYGTVISALGINPTSLTQKALQSWEKEFGCKFEKGDLLIWVEANEEQADQIFDLLRKRNFHFE